MSQQFMLDSNYGYRGNFGPNGTTLAWHALGAGFKFPQDQTFMLVPSDRAFTSIPLI